MTSWNPALNLFVDIKSTFIECYDEGSLWNYQIDNSFSDCVSYWVWYISNAGHSKRHYFQEVISNLLINEYNGMILFKYKNLGVDWDAYNGLYMECRSVVIDIYNDELILVPFRKFRNINECGENQIDCIQERVRNADHIEVTEKLDGSMCSMRYYDNAIIASGSQALDMRQSYRLNNYYDWAYYHNNIHRMLMAYPDYTFIFEGIFPNDVHIVQYDKSMIGLHLIGMRRVSTGEELPYHMVVTVAQNYKVPHVKIVNMTFEEAYQDAINSGRAANEAEGYVIDIDGYKVKCKYNDYVLMHKALSSMLSHKAIIRAIHENRWDDFYSKIPLAYQPQAKEIADNVYRYLEVYNNRTNRWYMKVQCAVQWDTDRKTFMLAVDDIVPQQFKGAVRAKFLNKDIDPLKGVKYADMLTAIEFYHVFDKQLKENILTTI